MISCLVSTIVIFYAWNNYLWGRLDMIAVFAVLLVLNAYFMLTTGKNPGFYDKKILESSKLLIMTS